MPFLTHGNLLYAFAVFLAVVYGQERRERNLNQDGRHTKESKAIEQPGLHA
ncbi:hypothetical protein AVEN_586-1 [Araneus ventricosus]|uniref:Uncharacterized protein n=1 Tax=Araneus ventricosus TaxID=182803 RepID=A0A4Y2VQK7_ARAVE|nr:hypothetical protein AVEN_586-1 [Araneus ventricosus]